MEGSGVAIERRIDEADSALACRETFLVDQVDDGGNKGSCHGGSTFTDEGTAGIHVRPCTVSSDIWVCAANAVVKTTIRADVLALGGGVVGIAWIVVVEVVGYHGVLICRALG